MNNWQKVGDIAPKSLTESRLQLHYAIQFAGAVGNFLTEPKADTSHISLTWNYDLNCFVSGTVAAEQPFQVALEPVSLTSIIVHRYSLEQFDLKAEEVNERFKDYCEYFQIVREFNHS